MTYQRPDYRLVVDDRKLAGHHQAKGWHQRWVATPDRFWSHVTFGPGCWIFATESRTGYGSFKGELAHRVAYEMAYGKIPAGLQIDHLCRTRQCVRPTHLEVVTKTENVLRGMGLGAQNARKDRCLNGHLFTPANTYVWKGRPGRRQCRECKRLTTRRLRQRAR